jgi:ribosomal protein S18 acetylase RimI-like enzyme
MTVHDPHRTHVPERGADRRAPLFCDRSLAARIEHAEAQLTAEATRAALRRRGGADGFVIPVGGGVATYAEEGSPFNKITGLGFDASPDPVALAEIEESFARRGTPPQVEVASLADPDLVPLLTARGYRLVGFEQVLGLDLPATPSLAGVPEVQVRRSGPDEVDLWVQLVTEAGLHPDDEGVPMEEFPRDVLERAERDSAATAGLRRYVAFHGGRPAGGASFRATDGIAQMTGAGTVPAHRRSGVQTALLAARIADAATDGCDVAVVTTQPGSRSQQNVQRRGFDLLYVRAVLVKEGASAPGAR